MIILVVVAHPDDEILGCGGTVARLTQEGHTVCIAILGEGITGRVADREQADPDEIKALADCSRRAARLLGAKLYLYNLPDNRFDTIPLLDIVKKIELLIEVIQPQCIYTHSGSDLNIDHSICHRAVLTATRPMGDQSVRTIYAFEVPSATEWGFGQLGAVFQPNTYVDITTTLETKIQAMELYESEVRASPHPRSSEMLRALARWRGSTVGVQAAEAFQLVREVK